MDLADLAALMGEEVTAESHSDLWVAIPSASAAALLGEARRLADGLGCYVHAVVAEADLAEEAIALGADRVHVAGPAAEFLAAQHPEFVLFPTDMDAQAASLAQRLQAGLITDARRLRVDEETRALTAAHPVYGGAYFTDLSVQSTVKMATVDPRLLPKPVSDASRVGEVVSNEFVAPAPNVADLGPVDHVPYAWRPLTRARIIVSAGNALEDREGFALAEQLAQRLGAELAGDQSARDFGWVDRAHQVGLTGQEVAPDLYLALGIRGDTVHNAAVAFARRVMAVHPNPDAPIFLIAEAGVVARPKEFLSHLLSQLA